MYTYVEVLNIPIMDKYTYLLCTCIEISSMYCCVAMNLVLCACTVNGFKRISCIFETLAPPPTKIHNSFNFILAKYHKGQIHKCQQCYVSII